jgi:DNA-binding MarR family transcriptional regulator
MILTLRQRHVLHVLAERGEAATTDWTAWYPLEHSVVRAVLGQLWKRGLVETCRVDGRTRLWELTPAGAKIEAILIQDEEEVS